MEVSIKNNYWTRRFKDYLERRELNDEVTALKFLILTQPMCQNKKIKKKNSRSKNISEQNLREIFVQAGKSFFSKNGKNQLCLGNRLLFNAIRETTDKLVDNANADWHKEYLDLMLMARKDLNVLENGLEPLFIKFMSTQDVTSGSTIAACLLSIL